MIKLVRLIGSHDSLIAGGLTGFLAFAYQGGGNTKRALYHFENCLRCLEEKLGPSHRVITETAETMAGLYHDVGEYELALSLYEKSITIRMEIVQEENSELADLYLKMGVTHEAIGAFEKALTCFDRARIIWERCLDPNDPNLGGVFYNLAMMHQKLNKFDEALDLYKRSLNIREYSLGPNDSEVAAILNNLGVLYKTLDRFDEALPLFQRALSIWEMQSSLYLPDIGQLLMNVAEMYDEKGEYDLAYPLFERSLFIVENVFGAHSKEVAHTLFNFGNLENRLDNFDKAKKKHEQSLKIFLDLLGPDHHQVGNGYIALANVYTKMGLFKEAITWCEKGVSICRRYFGPNHLEIGGGLNALAVLRQQMNEFHEALSLFKETLFILERHHGRNHSKVSSTLYNLGNLYAEMGNYGQAISYIQQALEINKTIFGYYHLEIGIPLNNLGNAYGNMGDNRRALDLYEQAHDVFKQALGPDNQYVAMTLNNIGSIYWEQKQYDNAIKNYQEALVIRERVLGPAHPHVADSLNNLALVFEAKGNFEDALIYFQNAAKIKEQVLGPDHIEVGRIETNVATCHFKMWNLDQALHHFKKAMHIENGYIKAVFNAVTSERQKLACIENVEKTFRGFLGLLNGYFKDVDSEIKYGFEQALNRKNIVLNAQLNINEVIRSKLSAESQKEWDKRQKLLEELAVFLLGTPQELKMNLDTYTTRKTKILSEIEEVEGRLWVNAKTSVKEIQIITFEGILGSLPEGVALVVYVRTGVPRAKMSDSRVKASSYYGAFVVSAEGALALIDLGSGIEIENSTESVLNAIRNELAECLEYEPDMNNLKNLNEKAHVALRDLYKKIWQPIEPNLGCPRYLYIYPDGDLNLIPFSALVDANGKFLIEKHLVAYLTSAQELFSKELLPTFQDIELLSIFNPDFGDKQEPNGNFEPLPQTKDEVQGIEATFPKSARILSLSGLGATKSAFKNLITEHGMPRILHLATHGFFRNPSPINANDYTNVDSYESPLSRSGLVFAGGNIGFPNISNERREHPGMLTALEITGMDLSGCQLAVLSGCNTGFGKVFNGEGVFGLRRAFILGGAKNVLMSLWVASDEDTTQQMIIFYQNLHTVSPAEALRISQLESIRSLKEEAGFAPVALWAPFIIQGTTAFQQWSNS